jgi:hypothetical protein
MNRAALVIRLGILLTLIGGGAAVGQETKWKVAGGLKFGGLEKEMDFALMPRKKNGGDIPGEFHIDVAGSAKIESVTFHRSQIGEGRPPSCKNIDDKVDKLLDGSVESFYMGVGFHDSDSDAHLLIFVPCSNGKKSEFKLVVRSAVPEFPAHNGVIHGSKRPSPSL